MEYGRLEVGKRLQVDKHTATVRYVGPLEGQPGNWIGLQWDDVTRGKHDGSLCGKKYFTCSDGHKSGSFVRVQKLLDVACFGISIAEALIQRYVGYISLQ
jgi:dynactin complex subunit